MSSVSSLPKASFSTIESLAALRPPLGKNTVLALDLDETLVQTDGIASEFSYQGVKLALDAEGENKNGHYDWYVKLRSRVS